MHDTILLQKISEELERLSYQNNMKRVKKISVIVNENSHVNQDNLYEHLLEINDQFFGPWTIIDIKRDKIEEQTAILSTIEGETEEV